MPADGHRRRSRRPGRLGALGDRRRRGELVAGRKARVARIAGGVEVAAQVSAGEAAQRLREAMVSVGTSRVPVRR